MSVKLVRFRVRQVPPERLASAHHELASFTLPGSPFVARVVTQRPLHYRDMVQRGIRLAPDLRGRLLAKALAIICRKTLADVVTGQADHCADNRAPGLVANSIKKSPMRSTILQIKQAGDGVFKELKVEVRQVA